MAASETETNWKAELQKLKGRTITGYATGAIGGRLDDLMLTFDDGTWMSFVIRPTSAVWDGVHIEVETGGRPDGSTS